MRAHSPFVLVVDGYRDAAESTRDVLTLHGFDVRTAGSCAEALAACADVPAAIITEVQLPDGDGDTLAARVGATVRPVPVLIAVADGPPGGNGAFDHSFTKPADPRALVEVLRRYIPAATV